MSEIGYKAWGLIPIDDAPTTNPPSVYQPPMLVNLALDCKASLVFQLSEAVSSLHVQINTTAVSADTDPDQALQLLVGPTADHLIQGETSSWQMQYDGPIAQYSTELKNSQIFLKLHYSGDLGIVVTSAYFSTL